MYKKEQKFDFLLITFSIASQEFFKITAQLLKIFL